MSSVHDCAYPTKLIEFTRRLGEAGYRTCDAQAALAKRGYRPSRSTVKRWLNPELWEAERMAKRKGGGVLPGPVPGMNWAWQRRLKRLHELREVGLSFRACADLMNHDFGLQMTKEHSESVVKGQLSLESIRVLMNGGRPRRGRK